MFFSPQAEYHHSICYLESIKLVLGKAGQESLIAAGVITVLALKLDYNGSLWVYNFQPILNSEWKLLPCKIIQQNAKHSSPPILLVFVAEIIGNTWSTMHLYFSVHL